MRSGTRPDSNNSLQKRFENPAKWWPVSEERMPGLMPTNSTRTPGLMRSVRGGRRGGSSLGNNVCCQVCAMLRPMRMIAIVMAVFAAVPTVSAQSTNSEKDAVLKTVQIFFDTMSAKDVAGARVILQPQGRFHAMRMRDGKPDVRAFSNEEYFADLQASKQKMRERI